MRALCGRPARNGLANPGSRAHDGHDSVVETKGIDRHGWLLQLMKSVLHNSRARVTANGAAPNCATCSKNWELRIKNAYW